MLILDGKKYYTREEKIAKMEKEINDFIESIKLANGIAYIESAEGVEEIKKYYILIAEGLKEELNKLKENNHGKKM